MKYDSFLIAINILDKILFRLRFVSRSFIMSTLIICTQCKMYGIMRSWRSCTRDIDD